MLDTGTGSRFQMADKFYYSEEQPTDTSHTYWHYVNGERVIWG